MHQQATVAGEKGVILTGHDCDELSIFGIPIISDVDSEQAKITDEFS